MKARTSMSPDASDFLAALSFSAGEESPLLDLNVYKYHPGIISAVEKFCAVFREHCAEMGLPDPGSLERAFGGNVFFSLSGHGCGFQDDSGPWGDVFQSVLENFAGSRYRFENLSSDLWRGERKRNLANLCFKKEHIAEYLEEYFGTPDLSSLPLPAVYLSIAFCPAKSDLRAVPGPVAIFTAPPYWTGEAWTVEPFTVERFETLIESIG